MCFDDFYGPFYQYIDGDRVTIFIEFTSNKNDTIRVQYGSFLYSICLSKVRKYFKSIKFNTYDELVNSINFNQCFNNLFKDLLLNKRMYIFFKKRASSFLGELPYSNSYCYILGQKKEILSNLSNLDSNKIYASNYESFIKMYEELALFYFNKRIAYLKELMGINYPIQVKLADAKTFIGVNYISKKLIKLDSYLYSYKQEVSDCILIHELAHCYQANHSSKFYEIVLRYCPNYYRYHDIINAGRYEDE